MSQEDQTLDNIQRIIAEAQESGACTLAELANQKEKIKRINNKVEQTDKSVDKSNVILRKMEKCTIQ